jgi:alpha-2-macroglobulin
MKPCIHALLFLSLLSLWPDAAEAQPPLTVVSTAPQGEVASLNEASEVRVVFSEPMVTLGRIPARVEAPFFRVTPAIPGTFRWSGTTVLIFTPDPKRPLPYATAYEVTIDTSAAAVSGRRLAKPVTFRFTTPTVKLLETSWYRRGGTSEGTMLVMLRFNQPVRGADVLSHLDARLEPVAWTPPSFTPEEEARLRETAPGALEQFAAKVARTHAVKAGGQPVPLRLASDWDKEQFPPSADLVAFEATGRVMPGSRVGLRLGAALPSPAGTATPGAPQAYTFDAEEAFFIRGFRCRSQCDGDGWNPIELSGRVMADEFGAALTVADITSAPETRIDRSAPARTRAYALDAWHMLTLEDAGFGRQLPARRLAVAARPDLRSVDGQTLGYTWAGVVDNWHMRAFTSFGDGHGVWETGGGTDLPFYARNFQNVTQWARPLQPSELMPTLRGLQENWFNFAPGGAGVERRLGGSPDRILSHGLDISGALGARKTGLVWAAVRDGTPIERARANTDEQGGPRTRSTVVQVTNLGITVKDSPQNTLIFVTRLDTGAPVPNAGVSIVRLDNSVFWKGATGPDGLALVPRTPLREGNDTWSFAFLVLAEKDGDIAYVGSNWNEGIRSWDFGVPVNLNEAEPLLRGTVFTDRGVYRLGEEVQFKAILRLNTPDGVRMLPNGAPVVISIRDAQYRLVDERTVSVNGWSSTEWKMTLPEGGSLGNYSIRAVLESDRPKPKTPEERDPGAEPGPYDDDHVVYGKAVHGSFLVAAYRRPDFRVDVTLTGAPAIAGDLLEGLITARYLFGAPMGPRPVTWRYSRTPGSNAPSAITQRFGEDRWTFVGWSDRQEDIVRPGELGRAEATLTKAGELSLDLETLRDAGIPYVYTLEGDVEDVSRQRLANRAGLTVHPAPWYIGVRRPSYFINQKDGLTTEVVAVALDGSPEAGVPVEVTLTQVQWVSVRRAEGNGFFTWDTERREIPAGKWNVTSASDPVPLQVAFENGGYFLLEARGRTGDGRSAVTRTSFYVLGEGYTAWRRFDHNRIDLVPERQTYKPGDTARIMIQSPWEQATALVTTEREGIRSHRQFMLRSTQESIEIPIAEQDIPNVFVSVLLIKGRTVAPPAAGDAAAKPDADASDPGKPAFRLGYVELKVEDRTKRLTVAVVADQAEYRPASAATVRLDVRDHAGRGTASEVTLWAVDYGVLSLTAYSTPDVLGSVYVRKALQVMNADSRQRIISRRVLTPKGETDGGGGGVDGGAGMLRKDFRVLAFWLGSVTTDAEGRASVNVTLPESLTTYRIMAVAADRTSRFGSSETEVRTNKPLTLKPAYPRFLAVGDRAHFGAVVGSQLTSGGTAVVTMTSLDPGVLELTGAGEQRVNVPAGSNVEVRFDGIGKAIGSARIRMTARMGNETDAFEDIIPVEVLVSPETVAAHGEARGDTVTTGETLAAPAGVVPGYGGLHVELSSTAMVGLGEGARYLVEYPYGCAEQKASRALALLLAADLGEAFTLPGMDTAKMRPAVQATLKELETFQCDNGGFAYWPGRCMSDSPYLTAYVLQVFQAAVNLKYDVDRGVRDRAYEYLERALTSGPPVNDGWRPAYTAWQAFAVKVLAEGGRNQDSNINRLYGHRDRMPVFALAFLHDALLARAETAGARAEDLRRRMSNALRVAGGSAHVEELSDPYLLWFWNSNVRSTAIVLNTLVKAGVQDAPITGIVRWLMAARENGRWGNTQENAYAMESLVAYYRKYEAEVPDFTAVVRLGEEELARARFAGRSAEAQRTDVPMATLQAAGAGSTRPLTFSREGTGTLFFSTRLRYAVDTPLQDGLDAGFHIERSYAPFVEDAVRPAATTYQAGDLVRVTLRFTLTQERRFVAVTDPLPAGFEAVESWFASTARALAQEQDQQSNPDDVPGEEEEWSRWWRRGGFDHVERHDNRVRLFATRLSAGVHEFSYIARATTAGTFRTAPAHAEEMYEPEVFGRTASTVIEIRREEGEGGRVRVEG